MHAGESGGSTVPGLDASRKEHRTVYLDPGLTAGALRVEVTFVVGTEVIH